MTQTQSMHSILIVDDDPDDRESIRDAFLEKNHHQDYVLIENGTKLFDLLYNMKDSNFPSLILLDLNMPGKDGKEILKEIKGNKFFYRIPVIILTTSASPKDVEVSYALGANCFVTKPDSFAKLVEIADCIAKLWLLYPYQ